MHKKRPDMRRDGAPGWIRVVDDFGALVRFTHVEELDDLFRRPATQAEKEAISITLDWLRAHCEIDPEDESGCWRWRGFITRQGQPQARMLVAPHVHATMLVRRLIAKLTLEGAKLPGGASVEAFMAKRQAGVRAECERGCCNPDHVMLRTKTQSAAPTRGKPISLPHRMAISRARTRDSKVDADGIREILLSPESAKDISLRLGMDPSYASKVRRGELRQVHTGGVFRDLAMVVRDLGRMQR